MLKLVEAVAGIQDGDEVFQESSIRALLEGHYDGVVSYAEIARHGDFGLGTFDALDGEMVAVGGEFFQITSDGRVHSVLPEQTAPFAVVKFFQADQSFELAGPVSMSQLTRAIEDRLTDPQQVYAVRVKGRFPAVHARAVCRQSKPYPPLSQVQQREFEGRDLSGQAVGFRFPEEAQALNVPGYHLHFLSDDRRFGGHLFEFSGRDLTVEVDVASQLHLALPPGERRGDRLSPELYQAMQKVERKRS